MEYRKVCKVCGKIFCYNDNDLKSNKWNAVAGVLGSVASIANAVDGTRYDMYEQNKLADRAVSKITDFSKCPYCGSRDIRDLTEDEYRDFQDGLIGSSGTSGSNGIQINTNASTDALIQRGMLFLEEGNWKTAQAYFDNALDAEPTNSDAYIGKMMVDFRLKTIDDLNKYDQTIDANPNFIKALRFASGEKLEQIEKIGQNIKRRITNIENEAKYQEAIHLLNLGGFSNIDAAQQVFTNLDTFKDSQVYIEKCIEEKFKYAKNQINKEESSSISEGIKILNSISNYGNSSDLVLQAERRLKEVTEKEEEKAAAEAIEEELKSQRTKKIKIAVCIAAVVLSILGFIYATVIVPSNKYKTAISYYENGNYSEAYTLFSDLGNYKDSSSFKEDLYIYYLVPNSAVGDEIIYGKYEQNNNSSDGKEDIVWVVLAKEGDDKVLLLSKFGLDCQPYNSTETDVTWETCSLRGWLNGTFINDAFNENEKKIIQATKLSADKNDDFETNPGNSTVDKVFLLSQLEGEKYLPSDNDRICNGTEYAYAQGTKKWDDGNCAWWLRSPGTKNDVALLVIHSGGIGLKKEGYLDQYFGSTVTGDHFAVRPAIWLNISQ